MKRFMLVLILVSAMAMGLAGSSHAVQLQQGWYAQFEYVGLEGHMYPDREWASPWHATSPTGQFGALLVEASSPATSYGRRLTITEAYDAAPGILFEDWGAFGSENPYYQRISLGWQTNYDSSQLQLRMYRHRPTWNDDELLWSQLQNGPVAGIQTVDIHPYVLVPGDSIVFRLVAVPEPTSLAGLMLGAGALIRPLRRLLRR